MIFGTRIALPEKDAWKIGGNNVWNSITGATNRCFVQMLRSLLFDNCRAGIWNGCLVIGTTRTGRDENDDRSNDKSSDVLAGHSPKVCQYRVTYDDSKTRHISL